MGAGAAQRGAAEGMRAVRHTLAAIWIAITAVFVAQRITLAVVTDSPWGVLRAATVGVWAGAGWALACWGAFAFAGLFPLFGPRWGRNLLFSLVAAVAAGAAHVVIDGWIRGWLQPAPTSSASMYALIQTTLGRVNAMINLVVAGQVLHHIRALHAHRAAAAALARELHDAGQRLVATQLQPRFLTRTLETLADAAPRDPEGTERLMFRVATLLRSTLRLSSRRGIGADDDVRLTAAFLQVEAARRDIPVTFTHAMDDDAADATLPCYVVHPLAEALWAGADALGRPLAHVHASLTTDRDGLRVRVRSDVAGAAAHPAARALAEALAAENPRVSVSPSVHGGAPAASLEACVPLDEDEAAAAAPPHLPRPEAV
jgi:hypothetical protein